MVEFIKEKIGSAQLQKARDQQKQLSYFTQSDIQEDITITYLEEWARRKYRTEDYFLNFVKMIFREENFLTFFKYMREPLASAELVQDRIKPQLNRVFFSEDSYFKYLVKGKKVEEPEVLKCKEFNEWIFDAILFRYNDILIHDLEGTNLPYRDLVSIENVVAIESKHSTIKRVAYSATVNLDGTDEHGYIYLDSQAYIFYDKEFRERLNIPHDLGMCPADYIVPDKFKDDDTVRKSIFSYLREKLEEYVFLKTLQRMTEPNGAIPITVKLKTTENKKDDTITTDIEFPMAAGVVPKKADSQLQAGTIVSVPASAGQDAEGKLNMDLIQNYFKFYHMPVENLEYLNKRIIQIERDILVTTLGDFSESNEEAKNELQTGKGYDNKQDKLREISRVLSRIRNLSDFKMLALQNGPESVMVDCFYGSDFFLQTESELYTMFAQSPNTIERKNILVKLSTIRNKFNRERAKRESILYDLMPYVSDKDFGFAQAAGLDEVTFQYQTRFTYWISQFEAKFGDIVDMWDSFENMSDSEKLILINNLVTENIKDYVAKNPKPETDNPSEGGKG